MPWQGHSPAGWSQATAPTSGTPRVSLPPWAPSPGVEQGGGDNRFINSSKHSDITSGTAESKATTPVLNHAGDGDKATHSIHLQSPRRPVNKPGQQRTGLATGHHWDTEVTAPGWSPSLAETSRSLGQDAGGRTATQPREMSRGTLNTPLPPGSTRSNCSLAEAHSQLANAGQAALPHAGALLGSPTPALAEDCCKQQG
ncbi:uncharacterized protein WM294_008778 [Sarcoramphus papa]